jgi:membrane protease YdiL (CAAX protease family)
MTSSPPLATPARTPVPGPDPLLSWPRAVVLHLAPGVALLLAYLLSAPLLHDAGLPPIWGLLLGIAVVVVPIELGLVLRAARRRGATAGWVALGVRRPGRRDLVPLTLAALAALLLPGLGVALEPWLAGALPEGAGAGLAGLAGYPAAVQVATVLLWLVLAVVVGPVVEELYFRGWLLPRLRGGAPTVCLAGAALFAVYHLWQPQAVLTVFLTALPLTVLVRLRGNVALSVAVHCGVNLLALGGLLAGVLDR